MVTAARIKKTITTFDFIVIFDNVPIPSVGADLVKRGLSERRSSSHAMRPKAGKLIKIKRGGIKFEKLPITFFSS